MVGTIELRTAVELFMSLSFLAASLLTLAFRNRRNPVVGFRVGYTYQSKRAWKKANTVTGLFSLGYSIVLLAMALEGVRLMVFLTLVMALTIAGLWLGTHVARREYEIEDLSEEAPEKPSRELRTNVGPYLVVQLVALAFYLLLITLLWNELPSVMATHFSLSGKPNGFSSRLTGVITPLMVWPILFALTLLARDPAFFVRRNFYPTTWRGWAELMTLINTGLVALSTVTVLYNLNVVGNSIVTYSTVLFLVVMFLGVYRLIMAGRGGRAGS